RTRAFVLSITAPVIVFTLVGGMLGRAMGREETYQNLKMFDDVVSLISSNYVEPANLDKVMKGAMNGLIDSLDADSAYLTPEQVKAFESNAALPAGETGIELTRQYYLRVIAVRENSPAAKAGLRRGDYVRAVNDMPTRDMSVWEGNRLLRGAPGSKVKLTVFRNNQADPHDVELTREAIPAGDVTSRIASPGVGYIRVPSIGPRTVDQVKSQIATLTREGATRFALDVRRTASGTYEQGIALARLFVAKGTLAQKDVKGAANHDLIVANNGDGSITAPLVVLVDSGTAGASELFASALVGNQRAELVGEHTIGRAGIQKLIKLPDGSALWLTTARYLTPAGAPLHEKGLEPTVIVELPEVEFGQQPPAGDPTLDKALERLTEKKAA
ncbi:MAG TPA: S41 family peptidase, partial [Vicinamibacterales bacterium]|nr:S41 family peptidase [Vicinamibacterales bacterium]